MTCILSGYTDEEPEVLEYKVNIRDEQKVHLVCRYPSSDQKVRYRMHTDPEGIVTKVEREEDKVQDGLGRTEANGARSEAIAMALKIRFMSICVNLVFFSYFC